MFGPMTFVEKALALLWAGAAGLCLGLPADTPARFAALPLPARGGLGAGVAAGLFVLLFFSAIAVGARMSTGRPLGATRETDPTPGPLAARPPQTT